MTLNVEPVWTVFAVAAVLLMLAPGCASPSEEVSERRGVGDLGLQVRGQPSEESQAIREGRSDLHFRVQDYEHHLERRSPDGRITITSEPSNAQVYLIDRSGMEVFQGSTSLEFFARANGMSHIFVLRKPGYVDRRIDVAVSYRNPDVRVNVVLEEDLSLRDVEVSGRTPFDHVQDYWNVRESRVHSREMPVGRGDRTHTRFPDLDETEDPR